MVNTTEPEKDKHTQINVGRDLEAGQVGDRYVTGGGDYVKGNKTEKTTTLSGDFRGAIVNIGMWSVSKRWRVGIIALIVVLLITLFVLLFNDALPILGRPPTVPPTFAYAVRVKSKVTGAEIPGASVTIEVAKQAPLDDVTDSNGIARITIDGNRVGQPARLIVQVAGYEQHEQNIDLREDILPDIVQLQPDTMDGEAISPSLAPSVTNTITQAPEPVATLPEDSTASANSPDATPTNQLVLAETANAPRSAEVGIEAPSTTSKSTPTSMPTNTPIATPTQDTHAPSATATPAQVGGLQATNTPIAPISIPGTGFLEVFVDSEICGDRVFWYELVSDSAGRVTGNEARLLEVAEGSYSLEINDVGISLAKEDVIVREGETTTVEFSNKLGKLETTGYPDIGWPLLQVSSLGKFNGGAACVSIGEYEISLVKVSCHSSMFGPSCITIMLVPSDVDAELNILIEAEKTATVKPEDWPYQFGRLLIGPKRYVGSATVDDLERNMQFAGDLDRSNQTYWMLPGSYRLTFNDQPFAGTIYEFEIKAGEDTHILLPEG